MSAVPLETRFVRIAGLCALAAAAAALCNLVLTSVVAGFNPATNPYHSAAVAAGVAGGAALLRWSLIADLFGYYLLLLPLAVALQAAMARRSSSWAQLLTVAGVGSILLGAAGAAILAAAWPPLVEAYRDGDRRLPEQLYVTLSQGIYGGLWNLAVSALHGTWVLGVGLLLRGAHPRLGWLSLVLGTITLVDALAAILVPGPIHEAVLFGYLFLTPVWSLCWGLFLVRGSAPSPSEL